jgi:hypothetical protein
MLRFVNFFPLFLFISSPLVQTKTPVQVSTLLVDVPPVRVSINSRQIKRNTITTNRVEKKNSEENLPKTVNIKCKQTTTVASLSIVTGKSPCTDSHYEKVVFSRTSEADYVIGKVKMKNILVINKLDRSNAGIRHIAMEDNKTEYESYMFYQQKLWDVRKTEDEEIRMYAKQILRMDRYAEQYKLCPSCLTCPTKYNFLIMRICTWAFPCYYI